MSDERTSDTSAEATFLATASHEIRTPLNGILGTVSLLLETDLQPAQKEYAETIHQSGVRLLELLNNVLDYARLDADALEVEHVEFVPSELAREVVELLAPRAHAKNIDIAVRMSRRAARVACSDAGRIRQILFNLIGNALKFTEVGGVLVDVTAPDDQIIFSIYDSGPGIAEDKQAGLFEAFRQSDTADAYKDGGVGLGLAIVRRLTQALGGDLSVMSAPGWGACFRVTLPNGGLEDAAEANLAEPDPRAVYLVGLPKPTILAISQTLAQHHCRIMLAERASDIPRKHGNIVLIGANLPQSKIKACAARAPTLIVLRGEDRSALPTFRKLGCKGWLIRPLRVSSLLERIDLSLAGEGDWNEDETAVDKTIRPRGNHVLVADDNPINALIARRALEHAGFSVTVVGTGSEALESSAVIDYALVLMDLRMPVMDGFEAIKQLRARGHDMPIIAISAEVNTMVENRALGAGANGVAAKPIDADRIRQIAARWTSQATQRDIA